MKLMKNPAKCGTDLLKERIYVCHTYYHVYIACLKELYLPEERPGAFWLESMDVSAQPDFHPEWIWEVLPGYGGQ